MKYLISGTTHIGRIRSNNQDNFYCEGSIKEPENDRKTIERAVDRNSPWTMAVFDGMGGEKDGEIASFLAAEITAEHSKTIKEELDLESLIVKINDRICEEIESRKCRMGSTCVFIEVEGNKARSWNIGDSRAYLFHDRNLRQLTEDHTEAASLSLIFNNDSHVKTGSENRLTQNLGIPEDEFIIEPFTSEWNEVEQGDILLLCSDGLTHMVCDEVISEVLKTEASLNNKCEKLVSLALENGGLDNVTIILAEVE